MILVKLTLMLVLLKTAVTLKKRVIPQLMAASLARFLDLALQLGDLADTESLIIVRLQASVKPIPLPIIFLHSAIKSTQLTLSSQPR